jgi:anti-anti-sigma factor
MQLFTVEPDADGVLWLSGELDLNGGENLRSAADAAIDPRRELVLDLSELEFIDSSGVRAIIRVARCSPKGLVLRRPDLRVRRVLETIGILGHGGIRIEG